MPKLHGTDTRLQPGVDLALGFGVQNVPRFRFGGFVGPELADRVVIGMNLYREPVLRIEQLHEPGKNRKALGGGTEQAAAIGLHQLP